PVTDLVLPMDNAPNHFSQLNNLAQGRGNGANAALRTGGATPYVGSNGLGGGEDAGLSQLASSATPTVTVENPKRTIVEVLIRLITNTIAPTTWTTVGGRATIDFFPVGLALVINQSPDI